MRRNDHIGEKFDMLTVVAPHEDGQKVICRCECGNEKVAFKVDLKAGKTKSCGCRRREIARAKSVDRSGQKIGRLTLIKRARLDDQIYLCRCECGVEKEVNYHDVSSGRTVSCGCKRSEPWANLSKRTEKMAGMKYGRLTFIKFVTRKEAVFKCDCGKYTQAFVTNVMHKDPSKRTGSCGCLFKEVAVTLTPPASEILKQRAQRRNEAMVGKKYGKLTVLEAVPINRVKAKCECGTIKEYRPAGLLSGHAGSCGCSSGGRSKGELEVEAWIRSLGFETGRVERTGLPGGLELDITVPSKMIAVEYHGQKYHSEDTKPPGYHKSKMEFANKLGYRLVQVFDFEWQYKNRQIKSFIAAALGISKRTVGARSLEIKRCDVHDIKRLLETTHIQGFTAGTLYIGCFENGVLLGGAVFGPHPIDSTREGLFLNRWCVEEGFSLPGALTKVCNLALELSNAKELGTWADLRFTQGGGYIASGWEKTGESRPDYFYWDPVSKRIIHKHQRMKKKVFTPEDMTESVHAEIDDLIAMWDCGKAYFRLKAPCSSAP